MALFAPLLDISTGGLSGRRTFLFPASISSLPRAAKGRVEQILENKHLLVDLGPALFVLTFSLLFNIIPSEIRSPIAFLGGRLGKKEKEIGKQEILM
ncbi:MAG: hypothetical protein OEW45_03520 [Deltaproteobacteria bacterium]|nr:hypothetical protein [Deltaproteobacteria bacterium]